MAVHLQTRYTLLLENTDKLMLHMRFEYSQVFYRCFHFLFNPMRSFVYKMDQNNIVAPATKRRRRSREAAGAPSDRPAQPSYYWEQSPGFSCQSALVLDHNYCCCLKKKCQKKKKLSASFYYSCFLNALHNLHSPNQHWWTLISHININFSADNVTKDSKGVS